MERETETLLVLASHTIKFATNHPYAATGVIGALVGSAVTYKAMTFSQKRSVISDIFTPKVYKLDLPHSDLRLLLNDPLAELRWDTPEFSLVVAAEKQESLKELAFIDGKAEDVY